MILIVDDDTGMRDTLGDILQDFGYRVRTASDGLQAVEEVGRQKPDVVVMDVVMPKMNGVDALKEMLTRFPNLPVIIMTAYAVEDLIREALRVGAFALIYKPIQPRQIISMVGRALEHYAA